MKSSPGFTLIELLVIVAIIAILAGIAVPNFLEAQVRSKVSRATVDMAAVSTALRSYYADHNRYPSNNHELRRFLQAASAVEELNAGTLPTPPEAPLSWTADDPEASQRRTLTELGYPEWSKTRGGAGSFPVLVTSGFDLRVLTTPISYHRGSLPADPFQDGSTLPFMYINQADLQTTGTESEGSGHLRRYVLLSYGPDKNASEATFHPSRGPFLPYDPTNGTVSPGDIVQYGDGASGARAEDLKTPGAAMPRAVDASGDADPI